MLHLSVLSTGGKIKTGERLRQQPPNSVSTVWKYDRFAFYGNRSFESTRTTTKKCISKYVVFYGSPKKNVMTFDETYDNLSRVTDKRVKWPSLARTHQTCAFHFWFQLLCIVSSFSFFFSLSQIISRLFWVHYKGWSSSPWRPEILLPFLIRRLFVCCPGDEHVTTISGMSSALTRCSHPFFPHQFSLNEYHMAFNFFWMIRSWQRDDNIHDNWQYISFHFIFDYINSCSISIAYQIV